MCGGAPETSGLLRSEGAQTQVDSSPCCRCVQEDIILHLVHCLEFKNFMPFLFCRNINENGVLNVFFSFPLQLLRAKWTACFYWSTRNTVLTLLTAQIQRDSEYIHVQNSYLFLVASLLFCTIAFSCTQCKWKQYLHSCRTALMLAALGGHIDCVHILLEKGAKADAADTKGFTALHRAVCVFACLEKRIPGCSALTRSLLFP